MAKGNIDEKALRQALKDAKVKFGGRTGIDKLIALAEANNVKVPAKAKGAGMIGEDYRKKYGKEQTINDAIAKALRKAVVVEPKDGKGRSTVDKKALKAIAKANSVKQFDSWDHLNVGQQRMNLGNVLRGMHNRNEQVVIGDKVFKGSKDGAGAPL